MTRRHHPASESLAPASSVSVPGAEISAALDRLLSDVLQTIRLKGAVFFAWQPRWPYATGVPNGHHFRELILPSSEQVISYHIVIDGPCWAAVADLAPVQLHSGDILLLPHGDAYAISDQPRRPCDADIEPARQFFTQMAAGALPLVIRDGGDGPARNQLICGFLGCDRHPANRVLSALPKYLVLPRSALSNPINDLMDIVLRECQQPRAGSHFVLPRLGELLFVEVLRQYLLGSDSGQLWLRGLGDPLVARSLCLLHGRLGDDWTLEKLAAVLGSSRSTLAARFHQVVGVPPMQYLTDWRMQVAAQLLRDGSDKLASIAARVGYHSEAAFSRAFKRVIGVNPAVWRHGPRAT